MPLELSDVFPLKRARVHEAQGAGVVSFAGALAAVLPGEVLWIAERWRMDHLNPQGLAAFFDPARLLMVHPKDHIDALACAEESLRSGAVGLVVAELSAPLTLTAGRRLQLAAEAGQVTGLCLIRDGQGSNAAQTRWTCQPVFDADDSTGARWDLKKNKSGTLGAWHVRWDDAARRVHVVSPVAQRPGPAGAPD